MFNGTERTLRPELCDSVCDHTSVRVCEMFTDVLLLDGGKKTLETSRRKGFQIQFLAQDLHVVSGTNQIHVRSPGWREKKSSSPSVKMKGRLSVVVHKTFVQLHGETAAAQQQDKTKCLHTVCLVSENV